MKLLVNPLYGWGWYGSNGSPVDVPPSFDLSAEVIVAGEPFISVLGYLEDDQSHLLSGRCILLSQRHVPNDGVCNLLAYAERPSAPLPPTIEPVLTGFAHAVEIPVQSD